jgi:hypothetical protein
MNDPVFPMSVEQIKNSLRPMFIDFAPAKIERDVELWIKTRSEHEKAKYRQAVRELRKEPTLKYYKMLTIDQPPQ